MTFSKSPLDKILSLLFHFAGMAQAGAKLLRNNKQNIPQQNSYKDCNLYLKLNLRPNDCKKKIFLNF